MSLCVFRGRLNGLPEFAEGLEPEAETSKMARAFSAAFCHAFFLIVFLIFDNSIIRSRVKYF